MNRRQRKRKRRKRHQHFEATRTLDRPADTFSAANQRIEHGHIVPRMYQKAWEDHARRVRVCRVGEEQSSLKSTKLVATRGPYYRRVRPRSGEEIDDIEQSLAKLETKVAPHLRAVIAGKPLTVLRKGAISSLFGAQAVRGPSFFEQHEELHEDFHAELGESAFKPGFLESVGRDLDVAKAKSIEAQMDPNRKFMTMLQLANKLAGILALMQWRVVRFDGPVLAYSDHPLVIWPFNVPRAAPFARQKLGPLSTFEVRVPIAPDAALLMSWADRNDENDVRLGHEEAAEINAFVVSQAEEEWMFSDGTQPEIASGTFQPLSTKLDRSYDRSSIEGSIRHELASKFQRKIGGRKWVNEIYVAVDLSGANPGQAYSI